MIKRIHLNKNEYGSAGIIETIIAIGICITIISIFLYAMNNLYAVYNEPGVDLSAKSLGIMNTLIYQTGQDSSFNPEWQDSSGNIDPIKTIGLGTTRTLQYGVMGLNQSGEVNILDGPYPKNIIGAEMTCFLTGTKIVMSNESYKDIEEIQVGDMVKSYDEESKTIVNKTVTNVFHHLPYEMGEYYLIINNQLRVTPNHRFYSDNKWVYADDLKIGDSLFYPSSDYKVYSIKRVFERADTYNFEVEGNHNYFVGIYDTNILVHNPSVYILKPNTNPAGYVGEKINFVGGAIWGNTPYTYFWKFGDGQSTLPQTGGTSWSTQHIYNTAGDFRVELNVTDSNNIKDSAFKDITISPLPPGYELPEAKFTWFDGDGPYLSGTTICFDASGSEYYDEGMYPATFEWFEIINNIDYPFNPPPSNQIIFTHNFVNSNPHVVKLKLNDSCKNSDEFITTVQANKPEDFEPDSKPWILTGKEIYPKNDQATFLSYSSDYYVKYTNLGSTLGSPLIVTQYKIFELKNKKTSGLPILDYKKIVKLENYSNGSKSNYLEKYNDVKSALGLESEEKIYNYRIEIKGKGIQKIVFGASDENAIATESVSRDILIYKQPEAIEEPQNSGQWKIGFHPEYIEGEITVYLFLGGSPPS